MWSLFWKNMFSREKCGGTVSSPPPPISAGGGATFSPNFWNGGIEKNEFLLPSMDICLRGLTVSCQKKDFSK